jgi:hypothetical protein
MNRWLKIPTEYSEGLISNFLLKQYGARHIRSHGSHLIQVRDAFKFNSGAIMIVKEIGCGRILLENKKISGRLFRQTFDVSDI